MRAQTGTAKVSKNRGNPASQDTQTRMHEMLSGWKTKNLHEAGTLTSEKRVTCYESSKESHKVAELLAMSDNLNQYIGEALKAREEFEESFK